MNTGGKVVSNMDASTRERYEKWKRNRIKRRVIYPGIGLLLVMFGLVFMMGSCHGRKRAEGASRTVDKPTESVEELTKSAPAPVMTKEDEPSVYFFNSHPLELIGSTHDNLYVGDMSIVEVTHILADHLESHGVSTLVEERDVDEKLRENNWEFEMSFYAAGYFVRDAIRQYPNLELFIDIHRDGVAREYATVEIEGERYAQIMFVIGNENPRGYDENYAIAMDLHNMLEERSPGISRGVFFSGGPGRDGVYNQDISPMVQVIEIGTVDSTVEEVSRTVEVLAEVLADYLSALDESADDSDDDSDDESADDEDA